MSPRSDVVSLLGTHFAHALDDLASEDDRDYVARLLLLAHADGKRHGRSEAVVERVRADRAKAQRTAPSATEPAETSPVLAVDTTVKLADSFTLWRVQTWDVANDEHGRSAVVALRPLHLEEPA